MKRFTMVKQVFPCVLITSLLASPAYAATSGTEVPFSLVWAMIAVLCVSGLVVLALEDAADQREAELTASQLETDITTQAPKVATAKVAKNDDNIGKVEDDKLLEVVAA